MPPKKQAQLQVAIESQEEWNDFLSKEGLAVVDVYSAWCGPCKAIQGLLRRLKNEIGDDQLRFAVAKSDTIESLEPYREKSMPTFLIFGTGELVAVVRGALGPKLETTIKEKLTEEHQVLDGKKERVVVVDEGLGLPDVVLDDHLEEEEEEPPRPPPTHKDFTVMVIKPDAVQAGKVEEIMERVKNEGMEVIASQEHTFTKEEAAEFYKQHEGSDHFEELVEFMCSGPCMTLVLTKGDTGEGVVDEIRDLVGPKDVEQAKETAPQSIRAEYGTDTKMNAVHASDSHEMAARELAFFMPKLRLPYVPGTEPPIERTLALIRPDALAQHKDSILQKISEAGFEVAYQKELTLTKEQAEEFYKEHKDKDFYDSLTSHMSSGPVLALCLAREDAIAHWRHLLTASASEGTEDGEEEGEKEGEKEGEEGEGEGEKKPQVENLRTQFSVEGSDEVNPLHGSDNPEKAAAEVNFFFPVEHTLCAIKPHTDDKESIVKKIKESGFNVSLSHETTLTKEMAEQLYANQKDKEYFDDLVSMMTSGPSMFMVLSAPDAVSGWRAVMGPTDPDQAKDENPNSLRAMFGRTALENAVHGSSDKDHALQEIEQVFGPVKISPSGTIEAPKDEPPTTEEAQQSTDAKPPAEEKPPVEGAPTEGKPPEGEAPSEDKPPEGEAPVDDKPPEEGAPAEDKPPEGVAPVDDKPLEEGAPAEDKPPEGGAPAENKPPEEGAPAAPEGEAPVDDKIPEEGATPAEDKPPEGGAPADDKPPEEGATPAEATEEKPPEEEKPSETGKSEPPAAPTEGASEAT